MHKQRSADELSTLDTQRTTATLSTLSRIQIRNERRHAEIHALRSRGLTIAAIADQLHLNRTTVRRFVRVRSAADLRRATGQGPRGLDRFNSYLVRRWKESCQVAACLYNEVYALGYRGSKRTVKVQIATHLSDGLAAGTQQIKGLRLERRGK